MSEEPAVAASHSNAVLLARIDERTKGTDLAVHEIKDMVTKNYVTQTEFKPVKLIAFGFVAVILLAVVGALVLLVVPKH